MAVSPHSNQSALPFYFFTHQLTASALNWEGFVAGGDGTTNDAETCYAGLATIKTAFPDFHAVSTLPAKLTYESDSKFDNVSLIKNSFVAYELCPAVPLPGDDSDGLPDLRDDSGSGQRTERCLR